MVLLGVGGGVTWDSDAAAEWRECLDKARVLKQMKADLKNALTTAQSYVACKGGKLPDNDPMTIEIENINQQNEAKVEGEPADVNDLSALREGDGTAANEAIITLADGHREPATYTRAMPIARVVASRHKTARAAAATSPAVPAAPSRLRWPR